MRCRTSGLKGAGLLVLLCTAAGCGSSSAGPPADSAKLAASDASARLEGQWTLIDFQPQEVLEPVLASLLTAQKDKLTVTFRAGTMTVVGVGVTAERTYRVTQAAADGFALTLTDPTNVEYRVTGAFQGIDLMFKSLSDPWRGHGRLRRAR